MVDIRKAIIVVIVAMWVATIVTSVTALQTRESTSVDDLQYVDKTLGVISLELDNLLLEGELV